MLATLPLAPGVVAFGLLYGAMAREVGFAVWEAWGMSLIVHAGSAQFAVLGGWRTAGPDAAILTTLVVNLRHLLLGASVAPYLRGLPRTWKALLALWMSDESYALAIAEYQGGKGNRWYFLGTNVGTYLEWTTSGLVGAMLYTAVPHSNQYGFDLIFPLAFLGLLTTFLKDRSGLAVALIAGGLALWSAHALPGNWYIVLAGLAGSGAGLALEEGGRRWKRL
jgi:4-azaleucine resistance transporter AzlC